MTRSSGAIGGLSGRGLAARNLVAPRNRRIALLGPSHAANHFNTSTVGGDVAGTNPGPSASAQGAVNWAIVLSGGRANLEPADCFGYNGDWTDAMTWNGTAYPGIASRVQAAINGGAGHIVLMAPSANDRQAWTAAQSIAALRDKIIAPIVAAGIPLTIVLDFPHGDTTTTGLTYTLKSTAAEPQIDYWQATNRYLLSLDGQNGIAVVDSVRILMDPTSGFGRMLTGKSADPGLHLNQVGAYEVGRVIAGRLRRMYPPRAQLPLGTSDKINQAGANSTPGYQSVNPYFSGSGGTSGAGTGGTVGAGSVIPDGWTANPVSGLTATYSKVTTTSFAGTPYTAADDGPVSKDWLQIVLSGTATAQTEALLLRQSVAATIGDMLRGVVEYEVDAGVTGVASFYPYMWQAAGSPPTHQQYAMLRAPGVIAGTTWPNAPIHGIAPTPRWPIESGQFHLCLGAMLINGATISATIRVRGLAAGKGL